MTDMIQIGFDLDGIFISLPPVLPAWVIDRLYRVKDTTTLRYRIPGKFEQRIRLLSHEAFFRPPIKENIAFLEKLSQEKKYAFCMISSRFDFLREITAKLLKKYGLDRLIQDRYFNFQNEQPHIFKNRIIQEKKLKKFVDDDQYLLSFLATNNPKTDFYWLNKTIHKKMAKNLFAITSLKQIFETL